MSDSSTVGLGLLAAGAVSALIAVALFLRSRRFLGNAVSVQGLVTAMEEGTGSEGGTVYRPVVEFTTVDGQARKRR